ncbi:MAG: hypothetical protein OXC18_20310 [Desulfurellaceae bacterium]|nr:hypothetical protein [Desulfurellaceae bacterium]
MRRIVGILLLVAVLVGVGQWYLAGQASDYIAAEPRLSLSQALGGELAGFARADRPRVFRFPDDHGPHPAYRTEWWYYTGNLKSAAGRHFGFQLTFFRTALKAPTDRVGRTSAWGTQDVYMAHFALSDVAAQRFHAFQRLSRAALGLAGASAAPFRVWLEDWSVTGEMAAERPVSMQLSAEEQDVALDLRLRSEKPIVLHGRNGLSQKGAAAGQASYYYFLTRLRSDGVIRLGAEEFQVQGLSWMDREWSTSVLSEALQGWDWFAIQLTDGQELIVYQIRQQSGDIHPLSSGTLVAADGTSQALTSADFQIEVLRTWRSPADGTVYPAKWRLRIPGEAIELTITPYMADQEMHTLIRYWEGAVRAQGTAQGRSLAGDGYVELTGYGEKKAGSAVFGRMS